MRGRPLASIATRLGITLLLVLGAFLLRLWLEQWCPPNRFTVSIFYLVVVLASFFLGTVEAAIGALLSAVLAYWAFVTPTFAWKWDPVELISEGSFALTSAVDIYCIAAMKSAVRRYRTERSRFEMLAEGHAALFHDYSERTAHYLNLLSITLKRSTETAAGLDPDVIEEASRQAFTLSSLHRGQAGEAQATTAFLPFAQQLLENLVRGTGLRQATVRADGDDDPMASDRAGLLAILLAEWTHLALPWIEQDRGVGVHVTFTNGADIQHLSLVVTGAPSRRRESTSPLSPTRVADIIAAHLGGRLHIVQTEGRLSFDFAAPSQAPDEFALAPQPSLPVLAPHMTIN
jgi:hypothetical protein